LSRVSPLAVPVLLEIGRESVRTDTDEDTLLAEAEAIIAEATGVAEPPPVVPAIHRANLARRPTGARTTTMPRRTPRKQADLFH
jgi:ATP-dependent Lhr-like helicase